MAVSKVPLQLNKSICGVGHTIAWEPLTSRLNNGVARQERQRQKHSRNAANTGAMRLFVVHWCLF
jgi:hypothetical protein